MTDLRGIFAEAVGHHQAGRLDQAEAGYRAALSLDPNLAGAHNNLGTLLLEQDRLDEAVACYRKALSLAPDYAEALNNLGAALCRLGELDEGEARIRRALHLKPDLAGAHDNLGAALWERGKLREAEASVRRALTLAPGFMRALEHLGALLKDQGRLNDAIEVYRRLLQIAPDSDACNDLAWALAARGDTTAALETVQQSLQLRETAAARRVFVEIVTQLRWTSDNREARKLMARALAEPWARPGELSATAALLIKQKAEIGAAVARAVQAWPGPLPAAELFGAGGGEALRDELLLALLVSAQNTDVELERFLTMARRSMLQAGDGADHDLAFYAALARQCFINEYVFFQSQEETGRASALRDGLAAALEKDAPVSPFHLLAVAAYFPLHSVSGAHRLLAFDWPEPVTQVLTQQLREPEEEAQLRAAIPRLTAIEATVSRLVQNQYEENPYPRWVRMHLPEKTDSITQYLRQKFPQATIRRKNSETAEFLSAGCGTGQLPLTIAQSVTGRVLAIDLSLSSLGYAKRKARELGLAQIEFAQADILELGTLDRRFDVIECSGVLHHLADPFAGWRALLSLLKPGGFMLVGLYSEVGRQSIVEARRFIAERGYGASADDIRRCRQDLLAREQESGLAFFGDFFGTSGCRDLLFHVQEQRMRLPAIAAFLKENDLAFLGFETDDATLQSYRRRFPSDSSATDLQNWDTFENEKPNTFSRMYVFWIQKQGA